MRVLLSEGASTSAREAITALGLAGHHIEVCDPDPHCLGRFSRFVHKFHGCPPLGADPRGYLDFIIERISGERFDVLLPIHEQGLLFAKARERIVPHVAVALPSFESYERAHSKLGFTRMLAGLGLPQPMTLLVTSAHELGETRRLPVVLKTAIGTASRGTWVVTDDRQMQQAVAGIEAINGFEQTVLVQEFIDGPLEHAQAVFADGQLVACHAFRQIARGAGGGSSIKESVSDRPVRAAIARIGEYLHWHGALSLDYIVKASTGTPHFIDCNPRLVEPMSALLAGLDLVGLLLRVSRGDRPVSSPESRAGVRTHLAVQALLGTALREQTRRSVLRECWRLIRKRGPYAGSWEELTPVRMDWRSAVAPTVTALWLLATPAVAHELPRKGWGSHLLTPDTIRSIRTMNIAP